MSIDAGKWKQQDKQFPYVSECTTQSNSMKNSLPCYEYLYRLRPSIPKELYAYHLRRLLQMNTGGVSNELRLEMLDGVDREDIMYQDELDAIKNIFEDNITIYRGTSSDEQIPGICWTLHRYIAEDDFYRGRLFKAVIPKDKILVYLMHSEAEGEIIAHVTENYEIIG